MDKRTDKNYVYLTRFDHKGDPKDLFRLNAEDHNGLNTLTLPSGDILMTTRNRLLVYNPLNRNRKWINRTLNYYQRYSDRTIERLSRNSRETLLSNRTFPFRGDSSCIAIIDQYDPAFYEKGVLEIVSLQKGIFLPRFSLESGSELAPFIANINRDGRLFRGRETVIRVCPPFAGADVADTEKMISNDSEMVVRTPTSTRIHIPANSLEWADGSPVKEPLNLRYREFHDAWGILRAGIPMEVAGSDGQLRSAGMIDIRIGQEGREARFRKDAGIDIQLAPYRRAEGYDLYYLPNDSSWTVVDTFATDVNSRKAEDLARLDDKTPDPGRFNPGSNSFRIIRLGIWNIDKLWNRDDITNREVRFDFESSKELKDKRIAVYAVYRSENFVLPCRIWESREIGIPKDGEVDFIAVISDSTFAYVTAATLRAALAKDGELVLPSEVRKADQLPEMGGK